MRMPKLLRVGDTVAVLATSGPVIASRLEAGVEVLRRMGLRPWVMDSCFATHEYLAGTDDVRIKDLHRAFASRSVAGIFVARGGYGAARLLGGLDYDLIAANPKVFVGYSDVTALHVVFNQVCGFVTFHGPMPASDFYDGVDPFTLNALYGMIFEAGAGGLLATPQAGGQPCGAAGSFRQDNHMYDGTDYCGRWPLEGLLANPLGQPLVTIVPGVARGPLVGGNLCLLAASLGTPYEVDTRGRVLFLEETGEDAYRVDRMLLQLKQARKLRDAAGIVLGDFGPQTLETLAMPIRELIATEKKPTLGGLACGHLSPTLTLPLGAEVVLDASGGVLEMLSY